MHKNFWHDLKKPIIALAPMDGYTDSAYRRVCKQVNPDIIVFTEFTAARQIKFRANKALRRFQYHDSEQPIVAQIFGKEVEDFVAAAQYCEAAGFSGVDINMGCPAKRVVKSEHGMGLRKNPVLAQAIVNAVTHATSLPVSVKTRLGWSNAEELLTFGKMMEDAGANLLTIHGRTYEMPYRCTADFNPIYHLRQSISIPVLGNGGIASLQDGRNKLGNLDGFMIGQASFGNPWIFRDGPPPSLAEKFSLIKDHTRYLIDSKGEYTGSREMRKYLLIYLRTTPHFSLFRHDLVHAASLSAIESLLTDMVESQQSHAAIAS